MMTLSVLPSQDDLRPKRPFVVLTAVALALLALAALWSGFDDRLIDGVPVWAKPAKFALSFVVHFVTLALIVDALSPSGQSGRVVSLTGAVMATAFLSEIAYMIIQAAQAEASHFNISTPFHEAMYGIMGLGAVLLIAGPVAIAWVVRTDRQAAIGPATRAGIWWGALASFGLTLIVAGYMSGAEGHFVGTPSAAGASIPLLGWSAEVGDLRPAHFLSIHALQALPLLGIWLDQTGREPRLVPLAALGWSLLTLGMFAQALMGLPLVRL